MQGPVRSLPLSLRFSIHGGPVNPSVSDGAYSVSIGMVHATVGIRARETGGEADSHGRMDHPKISSHRKVNVPSTSRGRTGLRNPALDRASRRTIPQLDRTAQGLNLQSIHKADAWAVDGARIVFGPGIGSSAVRLTKACCACKARRASR
jgi:hypothetical protein